MRRTLTTLELRHHDTGDALLERARTFLRAKETVHSLLLALAERTPESEGESYFATVEDEGRVVLVAVRTPPRHIVLSELGDGASEDALDLVVSDLARRHPALPGAVGPRRVGLAFGSRWSSVTGVESRVRLSFKEFAAERVHLSRWPSGALRLATESEVELLAEWSHRFIDETGLPEEDRVSATPEAVLRRVRDQALSVWAVDDQPVTMAVARASSLARIGGVYTPPALRRRGYASACVAALTERLLEQGARKVTLSTDAANRTSNKIYTALGYRYIGDDVLLAFERRP